MEAPDPALKTLPDNAAYTLRRARIRISLGIDPRFLTDAEVDDWLERRDVMSARQLRKKTYEDDGCPLRVVELPAGKRILEKHIRQAEKQAESRAVPEAHKQI